MTVLDRIASANNFDPLLPARYVQWIGLLEAAPASKRQAMLAWMDVSLAAQTGEMEPPSATYEPVEGAERVRIAKGLRAVCSSDEAWAAVGLPGADFSQGVVLELQDCTGDLPGGSEGTARILAEFAGRVDVAASVKDGGWLVLSDTYFPGWSATVDGEPAEILPAQGVFRAVWVPAGEHLVQFVYRPWSFAIGAVVTGLCLLSALAGARIWRKR